MFRIKLSCGHQAVTDVAISLQYPEDQHYIYCQQCKNNKSPICWKEVVSFNEMHIMPSGASRIMPGDIMRVQPRLQSKPNRIRPFPYVTRRNQFSE